MGWEPRLHRTLCLTMLLIMLMVSQVAFAQTEPSQLIIETVPPTSDIYFALAGTVAVTDENGIAAFPPLADGEYELRLLLPPDKEDAETRQIFKMWQDGVQTPKRLVSIQGLTQLQAGFEVQKRFHLNFVDANGNEVDQERISAAAFHDEMAFAHDDAVWLTTETVVVDGRMLQTQAVTQRLTSVEVDGVNVVIPQVVEPMGAEVELLLFSAEISTRNTLFNFPLNNGIRLTYPDAKRLTYHLEAGKVEIDQLARGLYYAQPTNGLTPPIPFFLAENQQIELITIGWLEISMVVLCVLLIIGGVGLQKYPIVAGWILPTARTVQPRWATGFGLILLMLGISGVILFAYLLTQLSAHVTTATTQAEIDPTLPAPPVSATPSPALIPSVEPTATPTITPSPTVTPAEAIPTRPPLPTATPVTPIVEVAEIRSIPTPIIHTVVDGENLNDIARIYYGNAGLWNFILEANRASLQSVRELSIGQELVIPPILHTVTAGDTLSLIAEKYYGDRFAWEQIYNANQDVLSSPEVVEVGQQLIIPFVIDIP